MTKEFLLTTLGINDTRLIPEALMTVLFGDPVNRQKFYRAMLEANDFAMDREWFQPIYEAELSERGQKKQDFTPAAASQLAAMITDNGARRQGILEPTAGNGSMIIANGGNYAESGFRSTITRTTIRSSVGNFRTDRYRYSFSTCRSGEWLGMSITEMFWSSGL